MKLLSCNSVNVMHQPAGLGTVRCNRRHCEKWQPRHVTYLGHADETLLLTLCSIYSLRHVAQSQSFCTLARNNQGLNVRNAISSSCVHVALCHLRRIARLTYAIRIAHVCVIRIIALIKFRLYLTNHLFRCHHHPCAWSACWCIYFPVCKGTSTQCGRSGVSQCVSILRYGEVWRGVYVWYV